MQLAHIYILISKVNPLKDSFICQSKKNYQEICVINENECRI